MGWWQCISWNLLTTMDAKCAKKSLRRCAFLTAKKYIKLNSRIYRFYNLNISKKFRNNSGTVFLVFLFVLIANSCGARGLRGCRRRLPRCRRNGSKSRKLLEPNLKVKNLKGSLVPELVRSYLFESGSGDASSRGNTLTAAVMGDSRWTQLKDEITMLQKSVIPIWIQRLLSDIWAFANGLMAPVFFAVVDLCFLNGWSHGEDRPRLQPGWSSAVLLHLERQWPSHQHWEAAAGHCKFVFRGRVLQEWLDQSWGYFHQLITNVLWWKVYSNYFAQNL